MMWLTAPTHHVIAPNFPSAHDAYPFTVGDELKSDAEDASDTPETEKRKRRALVVDDAPDITEMLAMMLQHAGYDVVATFSAMEALNAARAQHFDVVLSDIGMPEMNGYELARNLRTLPDYEFVPLIAVTGFATHEDRGQAFNAGFDHFLTKPVNPMTLIELVERL
ncbi:MAG: response regulator [Pyrinomonadaceae bacterium]